MTTLSLTRLLFLAGAAGFSAQTAHAQDEQLDIGVRTHVVDRSVRWDHKAPRPSTGGHSRIYGILSVREIKSDLRLVHPVDESAILQLLSRELNANGFKLYAPGTKPEIVLTVGYGRGGLRNPYIRDQGETAGAGGVPQNPIGAPESNDTGATVTSINGAFPMQLYDEKTPGFEAKLQKAGYEKLYIQVTAWAYPATAKAKPRMLWKTVMVVDDPDHRDLNLVAEKMLEAGAPYFDRDITEPEADVYKPLPNAHVNVGSPEVVPPRAK